MTFHLTKYLTSPMVSISGGYIYIIFLAIMLHALGLYDNSTFFTWGTPITFMGVKVEDSSTYYSILSLIFVHSLVYSRRVSMLIVNMFTLYSEIDVIIIISGIMSQISFFLVIILANVISTNIINWQYIKNKKYVSVQNRLLDIV